MREHLETIDHSHAIGYLETLVQQNEPLSERVLKEMHNIIMRNIDNANAGKYRDLNVMITGASHVPPSATQVLEKMEEFFRWYEAEREFLHPVELAARVHADFVNIHPFKDGNGRTARLIMNLELMKAGFPTVIIPVESRPEYYKNLDIAATQGDYSPFTAQVADRTAKSFEPYWRLLES